MTQFSAVARGMKQAYQLGFKEASTNPALGAEDVNADGADSLASFLMSLATDSGPVGEQVRTFIAGDDVAEAIDTLQRHIKGLKIPSKYERWHSLGQEMGIQLNYIVDSVERLILPNDPKAAFNLLVALFEADGVAMENCLEHQWEVACAYHRASAEEII